MTTIVLDEQSGSTSIRDVVSQATDNLIELRQLTGELVGTLMLERPATEAEYARLIAEATADIDELRRRAHCPEPGISTTELLSKLLSLTLREKK